MKQRYRITIEIDRQMPTKDFKSEVKKWLEDEWWKSLGEIVYLATEKVEKKQ